MILVRKGFQSGGFQTKGFQVFSETADDDVLPEATARGTPSPTFGIAKRPVEVDNA